jgi:hypothetical protein
MAEKPGWAAIIKVAEAIPVTQIEMLAFPVSATDYRRVD